MKKDKRWYIVCSLLIATVLFSACSKQSAGAVIASEPTPPQSADVPLSVTLTAPATLANGESLPLTFTLANNTDKDLYVLTWHTPFEGIANKIFRVTRDGDTLLYEGILAMRGDPSPDDYVLIQAKSSKSVDVDLASVYDTAQAGVYTIEYTAPLLHIANSEKEMAKTQDDLRQTVIPSNRVTVTINAASPKPSEWDLAPGDLAIMGTVMDVSLSSRTIMLETPVEGFNIIALTEESVLVADDGRELTLREVQPGAMVKVSGQPGEAYTLIATQVYILDPTSDAAPPIGKASPQTPKAVPNQWETYINDDFGYQLYVPPGAEIIASGVTRVPNAAVPKGTSPEEYIAQLQAQYPGEICVQIQAALVYINILAPTDLGPDYVPCGRTGVGAGELVEKSEQVNIGGNIYSTEGFEYISAALDAGERLVDHNETFSVELADGTRIEYGARPQTNATYEDYAMKGRKVLLQILASYTSIDQ